LSPFGRRLALLFALSVAAAAWAQEFPEPTGYVVDQADLISAEDEQRITDLCKAVDQAGRAQIAVVTVGSTGMLHSKDYAVELFNRWGIGHKGKDDGLLILISLSSPMGGARERRIEIEVGYGLEGYITDLDAGRIIEDDMTPLMRGGQVSAGIYRGVYKVVERLDSELAAAGEAPAEASRPGTTPWFGFVVCLPPFLLFLFLAPLIGVLSRLFVRIRCQRCGAWCRKISDRLVARATTLRAGVREMVFVCPRCGWQKTVRKRFQLSQGYTSTGTYVGSSSGWSGGGGGSSFGGFGGGSSGGGGAGGSW
jgi:uncharacterized protein